MVVAGKRKSRPAEAPPAGWRNSNASASQSGSSAERTRRLSATNVAGAALSSGEDEGVDLTGDAAAAAAPAGYVPQLLKINSRGLSPAHQTLLQAVMARRFCRADELQQIWTDIERVVRASDAEYQNPFPLLSAAIADLNTVLRAVSLSIESCEYERDGVRYAGIVNISADEVSKNGTPFAPDQIKVLKSVLEVVVGQGGPLPWGQARAKANPTHMTQTAVEETLSLLAQEGWLLLAPVDESDPDSPLEVWPGPRVALELRTWLQTNFREQLPECALCQRPALTCRRTCANCKAVVHSHCAENESANFKCPSCKHVFEEDAGAGAMRD